MATTEHFYTGNNSTTSFAFTFPYLSNSDVKVELNNVVQTENTSGQTDNDYTINNTNIVFNTAPQTGVAIHIYRTTNVDSAQAQYAAGSSIRAADLNNNQTQLLYSAQEAGGQLIRQSDLKDSIINSAKIVDGSIATGDLADSLITTAKIAADAVTGAKIADDQINSEHYASGSIDTEHIADSNVTTAKIADSNVTTAKIADSNVTTAKIADSNVTTAKIADLNVTTAKIAADAITGAKIADDQINSEHYVDGSIDTAHIAGAQVTDAKLASNSVTTAKIADANVTADKVADGNITLAKLDSSCKQTSISDSDVQIPTSGAVVDYVAAQLQPFGGFEAVATEVAFPNTQPVSGVAISISDAGGVVINGSGVSTTGRTVGGSTVTINGFPSSLYSETLVAGVGLIVTSTGSSQTYNYHKILGKEDDIKQLSDDINDFNARYRVGSSNPTSALDSGDLFFNTGSGKLLVYNGTASAWEEAQSIGQYFINTISSYSGTGGNSASFNNSAYRFVLSNPGASAEQHIVSVNGVVQKPNSGTSQPSQGFAIDGSSIIFSAAPPSGADFFIITIGSSVNIGTPSNGTVTTDKLTSGAVTTVKIADQAVTLDKLLHGDANSNGKFLRANNGADPTFETIDLTALSAANLTSGTIPDARLPATLPAISGANLTGIDTDLVNDTSPQLGGALDTNNRNITFGDSTTNGHTVNRLTFGAHTNGDLQIYHSGTHSVIRTTTGSAGNLNIRSDNDLVIGTVASSETFINCIEDGAVELFHDNSKKIETTSAGVTVTGTVTDSKGNLRSIIQNVQSSTYTLVANDEGCHIRKTGAGAITIPAGVFSASGGAAVTIVNGHSAAIQLTQGSGCTMNNAADASTGNRTLASKGMATLLYINADECFISGAGLS